MTSTPRLVGDAPPIPGLAFRTATPDDWPAIVAVMNAARQADGIDEVQTAESLAGEHPESETFSLARDSLLAEVDGRVVAYVFANRVERDGVLVGESGGDVHPDHRRRGLGTALLRATRARLTEEFAADPRPLPRELRGYALDEEPGCIALLQAEGYVPVRYGFEMRRFLAGSLPEVAMPAGLQLRPVRAEDERAIFDADNEAFRDHWGFREPEEADFQVRFHGPDAEPSLWPVAWDGDEVAGSVMVAIYRDENEALGIRRGWLEHVSVRRPWRGRGLAKALCIAAFHVLREQGMDEAWLGVDAANPTGALQLYEGLGFHVGRRWQAFGRPLDGPAPAGWRSAGQTGA